MTEWQPYREPLRTMVMRNGTIALVAGAVATQGWGGLARWPVAATLMLWPSFGGHWIEVWFLNWLRPRLPAARSVQVPARIITWFLGGVLLWLGMRTTAIALTGLPRTFGLTWWMAGVVFIAIELVAQSALHVRGQPSFFNGRGASGPVTARNG